MESSITGRGQSSIVGCAGLSLCNILIHCSFSFSSAKDHKTASIIPFKIPHLLTTVPGCWIYNKYHLYRYLGRGGGVCAQVPAGKRQKKQCIGEWGNRIPDLVHAKHALYQLSYNPVIIFSHRIDQYETLRF